VRWLLSVPVGLTLRNCALCPQSEFLSFVLMSEETVVALKKRVLFSRYSMFTAWNKLNMRNEGLFSSLTA
jgi:hypothetical protein